MPAFEIYFINVEGIKGINICYNYHDDYKLRMQNKTSSGHFHKGKPWHGPPRTMTFSGRSNTSYNVS